jgi:hypothetical protein
MAIEKPAEVFLPLPKGAVSYCSGPTGDCWWLREALSLRDDPAGVPVEPGQVARLELGDTGGTFKVIVAPHEVEQLAAAWLKTVVDKYGLAGVEAIVADHAAFVAQSAPELMDPHVFGLIEEDVRRSYYKRGITGWRDDLAERQQQERAKRSRHGAPAGQPG